MIRFRMRRTRAKVFLVMAVLVFGIFIKIGYAYLSRDLSIDGLTLLPKNTWDVHFVDNSIVETENLDSCLGGDECSRITQHATIGQDGVSVSFGVEFHVIGDYYEFTVDVVNAGTIDAMLNEVIKEGLNGNTDYLDFTITYSDEIPISQYNKLSKNGGTETLKVKVTFIGKPEEDVNVNLGITVNYVQADNNAVQRPVPTVDFATDPWEDIIKAYKRGDPSNQLHTAMNEQTTREVSLDMDHNGTYETTAHLMIANLSKPTECNDNNFSQSACGFVLKFVEAIDSAIVNPAASGTTNGTGNNGGWEYSRMRAYLNGTKYREGEAAEIDFTNTGIIDALPNDLKDVIINTNVISGYGINGTANFETTDKLFLLDSREIYGPSFTHQNSTAKDSQRQLDYYNTLGITTTNRLVVGHKNLSGSAVVCWLRSASAANDYQFFRLDTNGSSTSGTSRYSCGVVPVFRIAG